MKEPLCALRAGPDFLNPLGNQSGKRTAWSRGTIRMLTFRKGMDKLAWCHAATLNSR